MDLVEFKKRVFDIRSISAGTKSIIPQIEKLYTDISIPMDAGVKPATDVIKMIDEIIKREEKILAEYPSENTYEKLRISLRGGLIRLNEIKNRLSV